MLEPSGRCRLQPEGRQSCQPLSRPGSDCQDAPRPSNTDRARLDELFDAHPRLEAGSQAQIEGRHQKTGTDNQR